MARVEIPAPGDLIMDTAGNVRVGVAVSLKLAGTSTDATHYSALTGGTSTTGGLVSGSDGTVVDGSGNRRYVDSGASLDMTILGRLKRLEPISASADGLVVNANGAPYGAAPGSSQSTAIQAAITAAAASGTRVVQITRPGTYLLNATLDLSAGNVCLRLAPGVILDYSGVTAEGSSYYGLKARGTVGSKTLLTADAVRQALTVTVADASPFAAGDYVQVGTQSPVSTLNGAIVSAVSTADITLTDATGFTTGPGKILLAAAGEAVSYTSRTGNVFTGIVRGVDGTTATTHLNGTYAIERNDVKSYPSYRTNPVADRGEIKRIDTISGGTITFEEALYDAYPTSNRAFIRKLTMVENVSVELNGGKVTGSTTIAQSKLEFGIDLLYVNGFKVTGGKMENTRNECVRVHSCLEGEVTGVRFRGTSLWTDAIETTYSGDWYGVGISGSSHSITVSNCKAEYLRRLSATYGYGGGLDYFGQPRSVTWTNNVARACHTEMFEQHGWGEDIICSENVSEGGYGLVRIEGGGIAVENNTVRGAELYAIVISADIREARDITIKGNRIRERAGIGDTSARAIMCDFTGVTVIENVEVSGNVINWDLTDRAAISTNSAVIVAADNFVIQDNRIMCNAARSTYAIDVYTPDTIIRGNVIRGSRHGIRVNADRCEVGPGNVVTMSTQNAVSGEAFHVNGVDGVRVIGNTCRFTYQAVTVAASSDDTVVQGNTFRVPSYLRGIIDSGTRTVALNNYYETDTPGDLQAASAATVTLPIRGNHIWRITGTTNITSVTIQAANTVITLKFDGALTFTAGSNLKLAGNFVTTADDTITLVSNGTNWYEMSRSANA